MQKRLLFVEYLGFIAIGLVATIVGPSLVAIRSDLRLNYSQAGLILSGQFFGMLLTVLFGGYIADRHGKKPFILAGSFFLTLGLFGSMLAGSYLVLLISTAVTGVGYGAYSVGINALCADYIRENPGSVLNRLHSFFAVGAIAGPVLATLSLRAFHSWRPAFGFLGLLPVVVGGILLTIPLQPPAAPPAHSDAKLFRQSFLWAASFAIFIYVGIEVSIYGWLPTLWKNLFGSALIPATATSSVFWLALTSGRLISGKLSDRAGLTRYLIAISSGVLLLSVAWQLLASTVWIIAVIFLIGLFLGGIYPTVMAFATSLAPGRTGEVTAFVSVFASLGGFLIPSGVGRLADRVGLGALPLLIAGLSVFLVLGMVTARVLAGKRP